MSSTVHTASRLHLSHLSPEVVQSDIRAMSVECDAVHGINLAQGICDTPIPAVVLDAAHQAIAEGRNTYSRLDGITPLRAALARKFYEYNNLDYDPAREILVTSGATGAFDAAVKALLNPGDEVLLFEPFYGYHLNTLLAVRAVPVAVPLSGDDFDLDRDALVAAITPRTAPSLSTRRPIPQEKFSRARNWSSSRPLPPSMTFSSSPTKSTSTSSTTASSTLAPHRCPECASAPSLSPASPRFSPSPDGASAISPPMRVGRQAWAIFRT